MTTPAEMGLTDPEVQRRISVALSVNETLLSAALAQARASFDHPGNKGDAVEEAVRTFLGHHLPSRFEVGQGEVVDRFGSRSSQLDVIVLNEDQPFNYGTSQPAMYLCEGVSAAAEVKSALGTKELADILAKGERFRTLRTTSSAGDQRFTCPSDARRFYTSAPYFGLAIESTMRAETILQKLVDEPEVLSPQPGGGSLPKVDALFVLNKGIFINFGDGQGGFGSYSQTLGRYQEGWVFHGQDSVLLSLFAWLNAVMPRVRRFNSIAVPYLALAGDASGPVVRPASPAGDPPQAVALDLK